MTTPIFFDLDGVLAGFVHGAHSYWSAAGRKGLPAVDEVQWGIEEQFGFGDDPERFWEPFGYEFWAGLPVLADGMSLFRSVASRHGAGLRILSTPHNVRGCRDGKYDWVKTHLPRYADSLFLGKNKSEIVHGAAVLVDDHGENIKKWKHAGGRGVLIPRPWNERKYECHPGGHFDVPSLYAEIMAHAQ